MALHHEALCSAVIRWLLSRELQRPRFVISLFSLLHVGIFLREYGNRNCSPTSRLASKVLKVAGVTDEDASHG
jgi:hypothetical protein